MAYYPIYTSRGRVGEVFKLGHGVRRERRVFRDTSDGDLVGCEDDEFINEITGNRWGWKTRAIVGKDGDVKFDTHFHLNATIGSDPINFDTRLNTDFILDDKELQKIKKKD